MTTCNTTNFTYTYGIYESHDDGNTWTMIGQYRDNVFS
jgi:quinol monooxygenase YgiN